MPWNIHLPTANWFTLQSPELEALVREAKAHKLIAIDTETTGLNICSDIPLYWSLCWGERRMCMPISTLAAFREVFAEEDRAWVFANAKFDMHMLANVGIEFKGRIYDVAVMHALLYEESSHALKDMAGQILGWKWQDFFDTFKAETVVGADGTKRKETIEERLRRIERTDLGVLVEYASNDAYGTMRLFDALNKELCNSPTFSLYPETFGTMADVYFKTEVPFTKVLYTCERNGILVNMPYLATTEPPLAKEIADIEREIVHVVGRALNPNSPLQLRDYFFKEKGYRPVKMSKGGKTGVRNPSSDKDVIKAFAEDGDPVAALILKHRELGKLLGTYVRGLHRVADPNGRVHTRFNQDVARTGRLSSSEPNLQNIPKPDKDKFKLRGAFISKPGHSLIVVDYEQLEMRLLAAAAMEPGMIGIINAGRDIHMGNAALVFGKKFDITYDDIVAAKKIDKQVAEGKLPESALTAKVKNCLFARNAAKSIGFGLNYGMKENKLARQLGVTTEEAIEMIDAYMATYPAVKQFYAEAIEETQKTGYAHTLLGRRRYLPEIHALSELDRWGAERKAVNTQIQGTAADACRLAMIHCYNSGLDKQFGCNMLLQVHDELVFECPDEHLEEAKEIIKDCMEHPFATDLAVPLAISMGTGPSWMHAK